MFARVATFEGFDVATAEETLDLMRDRMNDVLESIPGWQGGMTLAALEENRAVVINVFDTLESMDAAEPVFETLPARLGDAAAEMVAGRRVAVERFRVIAGMVPGAQFWISRP